MTPPPFSLCAHFYNRLRNPDKTLPGLRGFRRVWRLLSCTLRNFTFFSPESYLESDPPQLTQRVREGGLLCVLERACCVCACVFVVCVFVCVVSLRKGSDYSDFRGRYLRFMKTHTQFNQHQSVSEPRAVNDRLALHTHTPHCHFLSNWPVYPSTVSQLQSRHHAGVSRGCTRTHPMQIKFVFRRPEIESWLCYSLCTTLTTHYFCVDSRLSSRYCCLTQYQNYN